jgi:hypothetical protein
MSEEYNGWTNYETWIWNLWLDQDYYIEMAQENKLTEAQIEDILRENMEEFTPDLDTGPYLDILTANLNMINFREIAEHIASETEEEDEDDE